MLCFEKNIKQYLHLAEHVLLIIKAELFTQYNWGGFFSSQIFRSLKAEGLSYPHIFYITATLYAFWSVYVLFFDTRL